MSATAGKLSVGEEAYLRALTGRLVGIHLFKGLDRIAILAYPDRICESISAAAATAYLDSYGYGQGKVMVFDYSDNVDEVARRIVSWDAGAVYLAFGGEQRLATVDEVTRKVLRALRAAGFSGSLLIHVRAWLATKQFSTVTSDPELPGYLKSLKEVRLFTADAAVTKRAKVGTCAINPYTRNVGVVAAAAITLHDLSGGRFSIGLASGEEVIGAFGVVKERPLRDIREFVGALRSLLSGKEVSVDGGLVKLRKARAAMSVHVPVYVAATGLRTLRLGSRISDGVIFNFLVNDAYMRDAVKASEGSASKFQLIAASVDDDRRKALWLARKFVAKFIFLAPEFFKGIGVPSGVVDLVSRTVSGWPPSQDELEAAAALVPDEIAMRLMAVGNESDAALRVSEESRKWGTTPVIDFISESPKKAIEGVISRV